MKVKLLTNIYTHHNPYLKINEIVDVKQCQSTNDCFETIYLIDPIRNENVILYKGHCEIVDELDQNYKKASDILWQRLVNNIVARNREEFYKQVVKPYVEILKEIENEAKAQSR